MMEFEEINNLQAKVDILKNKLVSDANRLSSKRMNLVLMGQDLTLKK
jgi:hypothetical protein